VFAIDQGGLVVFKLQLLQPDRLSFAEWRYADRNEQFHRLGPVDYMSPERLCERVGGAAADVWALGMILVLLLTHKRPFDDSAGKRPSSDETKK
jgi:serine/threonine protein kinase